MRSFSFRQTVIKGIALALPLAIIAYVMIRIVGILEKVIAPLAKKAGISHMLGEITLTVIAILVLFILVLLLGLLMQLAFVASFRIYLQDLIIKLVPSLNHLKLIAAQHIELKDVEDTWKPVLLQDGDQFSPAFIIEETDEWITLVSVKPPSSDPDELFIAKRSSTRYKEITIKQMLQCNKQFGKGFLALMKDHVAGLMLILLVALNAQGQDTHYWMQQYGSRSALMGGAVVGGALDNTSIVYNPGSLGFVDTGSISINASLYQMQNIRIENAFGQKADFRNRSIGSIPLLVSGMVKTKNSRWKIGYGIFHPVSFDFKATARLDGFYPIVDNPASPGDEAFIGQQTINSSISELTIALGVARRLSDHWSIGLTNLFTARSQSYVKATLARFFLNDPDTTLVAATALQTFNYFHLRYAAKIGLAYRNGNIGVGLTFTTPGVKLAGKGGVAADVTATNVIINGRPRDNYLADDKQVKLSSVFHAPLSVSAGINIGLHRSLLALSAQYFGSEDVYDNLRAKPSAFVRPAGVYTTLSSDNFLRVKTGARSVCNVAVAYEYRLKEDLTLHLSARNDMSYYDTSLLSTPGIKADFTTWDIYHFTLGTTIRRGKSSISIGLLFSTGSDPDHQQEDNLSHPSENDFLQGTTTIAKASYSAIGFLLGYTYNFRK